MYERKIKVAFFISNLGQGGAEKQFVSLIKNLDPLRFEKHLYLYAYQKEAFYKDIFGYQNIKAFTNKLKYKWSFLKIIQAGLYIRRNLRNEEYDLVISSLFMNNVLVRLFSPGKYKNKCIANVRTSHSLYTKWHKLGEKIQIKNSFLIFNSNNAWAHFKKLISRKYHDRLYVIHNGFDIPKFIAPTSKMVFGCLGRLNVEKNIIQAVRVFQAFEKNHPSVKLILQGHQGNQYNDIVNLLDSANIELRKEDPDIDKYFQAIRVLILPSLFEGCPNVLFEALLRRRICIISNGANSDNFIVDGINGFVYDGTDQDLLNTLERVFNILDTETETSIIEAGYNYAAVNFSIDAMVNKYERLFLSIHESQ